jgi:uncharacterized protein with HEPN domain
MQQNERDQALVWDIREAAREITEYVQGTIYTRFAASKSLRAAVERQLITVGEAARQLSSEFKLAHPQIPWRTIVAQRNVLVHEYGEIRVEQLWLTATQDIPQLIQQIDSIASASGLTPPPPESPR